jgi:hypothetical protein
MFELEPRFVDLDNRRNRKIYPISITSLNKKHSAILPSSLIKDKSILDLGSCLSATGFWCLKNGAKHYTSVEIQKDYVDLANKIFKDHFDSSTYLILNKNLKTFLLENKEKYDIVLLLGCIYAFSNIFEILELVCNTSNNLIIIESRYPKGIKNINDSFIEFCSIGPMNLANVDKGLNSYGSYPTPAAIKNIFVKILDLMKGVG